MLYTYDELTLSADKQQSKSPHVRMKDAQTLALKYSISPQNIRNQIVYDFADILDVLTALMPA